MLTILRWSLKANTKVSLRIFESTAPGFFLAPLVWLQRSEVTPAITMQASEVAAWRWVPLKALSPEEVKFDVPLQTLANKGVDC